MLTARGDAMDRVVGLEMGADDYLPKPFEPRELLARLKAILRRRGTEQAAEMLRFGRLQIDPGALEVRLDGEPCALTSHQFALLLVLARHAGRVMSRDAIMDLLRHERLEAFDRSIDVHISRIRAKAETPILMLTARGDAMDRVVGLEMGADDYLPKPFEPRELLARLKAILRRRGGEKAADVLRFGRLQIDPGALEVRLDGEPRALTSYQFALLLALARHAGRVMSRDAIMDLLKHERLEAFDRSIDVHISRIRAAIEDNPKRPRRVITVRGAGYVFAKSQD
jgi:DNA-binding response OmpR family regulator